MSTIEERVARGAAWLNMMRPRWFEQIDLDTLDMSSPSDCVIGQLFDDYNNFDMEQARLHNGDGEWGLRLGFHTAGTARAFANLTRAWRRVITERRAAA